MTEFAISEDFLSFQEFEACVLTATDRHLRQVCLNRRGDSTLNAKGRELLCELLQREIRLHRNRNAVRKQLALSPGFIMEKVFR